MNSGLDCLTPVGKKFIKHQIETGYLIEKIWDVTVKHTEDDAAEFDCYIYSNKELVGVGEIKTRPLFNRKLKTICTLKKLEEKGTYLIDAAKLDVLQEQSRKNKVTSYIFVNLPNDKKLLVFKITNKKGEFLFEFVRDWQKTKFSSNDYKGDKNALCAFLPIVGNKYFKSFDY